MNVFTGVSVRAYRPEISTVSLMETHGNLLKQAGIVVRIVVKIRFIPHRLQRFLMALQIMHKNSPIGW